MTTETPKEAPLEVARDPVADTAETAPVAADPAPVPEPAVDDPGPTRPVVASNVDRANIAKKFNRGRDEAKAQIGFSGDLSDPAVLAGHLTQVQPEATIDPPEAATPAAAAPETPAEKRKIKVVVRREERELTEEELIAAAQKTLAGDDYLAEARKLLDETKRAVTSRPHPDAVTPAPERTDPGTEGQQPHPVVDPYRAAVEKIQFGDPEEAADALRAIATQNDPQKAEDVARKVLYDQQRAFEVTRLKQAYDKFATANKDLLADPLAHTVMTDLYFKELRADLKKIGYPDDRIPQDNNVLVEAHRFHRVQGQPVRDSDALLEQSKQSYLSWKGGPQPTPTPATPSSKVTVKVDRTERRAAIPQQPARSAVPPQLTTQDQVRPSTRAEAVKKMMKGRQQLVVT